MVVFWIASDLHVNYEANRNFVLSLSTETYRQDVALIAGDVAESLTLLRETLAHLAKCFRLVFYVVGNHELYVIKEVRTLGLGKRPRQATQTMV